MKLLKFILISGIVKYVERNHEQYKIKESVKMKVDVDYQTVHEAIEKIKKHSPLSAKEIDSVLAVLLAVQGGYIPTTNWLAKIGMQEY